MHQTELEIPEPKYNNFAAPQDTLYTVKESMS